MNANTESETQAAVPARLSTRLLVWLKGFNHPSGQKAPAGLAVFIMILAVADIYLWIRNGLAMDSEIGRRYADAGLRVNFMLITLLGTLLAFNPRTRMLAYVLLTAITAAAFMLVFRTLHR